MTGPSSMARGTQSGVSGTNLRCWWRRVIAYLLGMILPWSLLSQLLGTLLVGRSAPEGPAGWLADVIAFGLIVVVSALFTSDGQSLTHRLVRLQIREALWRTCVSPENGPTQYCSPCGFWLARFRISLAPLGLARSDVCRQTSWHSR